MKKILIPLPSYGFDPTEAAIPWKLMSGKGMKIVFVAPGGQKAGADRIVLTGKGLGIWKSILRARKDAVEAYDEMERSDAFSRPLKYDDAAEKDFDAILLPGGHDKGVKQYLESERLQKLVADFFTAGKPVGAICHGVILAARSKNPGTQQSVLYEYKTTSLLKSQELLGYHLTRLWLGDYYLTYPEITVEDEVKSVLADADQYLAGPTPMFRDDLAHLQRGFVVRDRNYVSGRWPGDAYSFTRAFSELVQKAE